MYGQLVSDIREYVAKAKFMGLENAESTRLLEIAAGVIEFENAALERLCHPMEKMWSVMPLLPDGWDVEWKKEGE